MFQEYETLQQWSTEDDVKPFLAGTTLGSILMIDRDSKGIETRYRQSVKPFLRQIAVIGGGQDSKEGKKGENASDKTSNRWGLGSSNRSHLDWDGVHSVQQQEKVMSSNGTQFRNLAPTNFEMRAISYFSLITQALTLAERCNPCTK